MKYKLGLTAMLVMDYDEAIVFFVERLGSRVTDDTYLTLSKRWVVVAPPGNAGAGLLLARAADARQERAVGDQAGGRLFLFLETDDFGRDFNVFREKGIRFVERPRTESYGTVAVFEDLYGNR